MLAILNSNNDDDTYVALSKYLLTHYHELDRISIFDVADECFVSRSSVQRFIKDIGFESYTAVKECLEETKIHQNAYLSYADDPDFVDHSFLAMDLMMRDIAHMAAEQGLSRLARDIHGCGNVVIVIDEMSGSAVKRFQNGMLAMGKLIRLVTNSTANNQLLADLKKSDMLITCSVTGNYAIACNDDIRGIHAQRVLVTMNHADLFRDTYDRIFYLSGDAYESDHITHGLQNVYTRYGASYFFDLLYHEYVMMYGTKPQETCKK